MDAQARLLEILARPSPTGGEGAYADRLEEEYADEPSVRIGNSLVVGAPDDRPLVLLVGHTDVVPPTDEDREPRRDGDLIVGRGASDMKGGVAVAEALYADHDLRASSTYNVVLVLYAAEEGPAEGNELGPVLDSVPWLADAELAVVLEPTDLDVHAGCLGTLHALLTISGTQAHSARPWQGDNALTKAGRLLAELHDREPVATEIDGLAYRDVLTATQAWTDNARNVVPGRFVVNVNYRFAPNRGLDEAERELRDWVAGRAEVEIVDRAPPAAPRLDSPLVSRFVEVVDAPVLAKQAWTDVGRLAQVGVPAVNYGPGLTSQAHQAGEHIPVANLATAERVLRRFLGR